jgi:hypothetical protein
MVERRDKHLGQNQTMIFVTLGVVVVLGAIGVMLFSHWKKLYPAVDPRLRNIEQQYLTAPADPTVNPEVSMMLQSNDPDFMAYQAWQNAKVEARKDLNKALSIVQETINRAPDLAGDAYFTMAQCVEFSMEIPLYWHYKKYRKPGISRAEMEARYDQEFGYYNKAIEAYGQPGARTLLGVTREPNEQIRKIRDTIMEEKKKIKAWWMDLAQ